MSRDLLLALAVLVAILAICFGVAAARPTTPPQPTPAVATAAAVPGAPSEAKPVGPVVMHVNGEPVTEAEFNLFLSSLPEQYQQMASNPGIRRQLAEQLVREKVLEQEARKMGADRDPEVAAKMSFGHTNVLVEYALKKLGTKAPEAQMRSAYEREKGAIPQVTSLAHIAIAYQGGQLQSRVSQPLPPQLAAQQAQLVIGKIKNGMPWEEAVRQFSDDERSSSQGGKIGDVPAGQLPPDLQQVLDKLKPGEMTGPVRTEFAIHIFKVLGRKAPSYEDLKPALERRIQQDIVQKEVERLQKQAKIDFDPKYFPPAPATPAPGMMPPPAGATQPRPGR